MSVFWPDPLVLLLQCDRYWKQWFRTAAWMIQPITVQAYGQDSHTTCEIHTQHCICTYMHTSFESMWVWIPFFNVTPVWSWSTVAWVSLCTTAPVHSSKTQVMWELFKKTVWKRASSVPEFLPTNTYKIVCSSPKTTKHQVSLVLCLYNCFWKVFTQMKPINIKSVILENCTCIVCLHSKDKALLWS